MAAYAAVTSLSQSLDQLSPTNSSHLILYKKEQTEILREKLTFFRAFLEEFTNVFHEDKKMKHLERMIQDVAHGVEDIIDSHVYDSLLYEGQSRKEQRKAYMIFHQNLQYSIEEMDLIQREHVRRAFPDDHNGSRIMLTTRLVDVASCASSGNSLHQMHFLSVEESWTLLRDKVFGNGKTREIPVWKLIRLWVAEGFIKKVKHKNIENVAEEILRDLVDRSLVLAGKRSSLGKIKTCKMHDLIRDMCLRETQGENFIHFITRYLACPFYHGLVQTICNRSNIQSLVIHDRNPCEMFMTTLSLPGEVSNMPRLRHIHTKSIRLFIPPPTAETDNHLQTLTGLMPSSCNDEVFLRVPNLKKLGILLVSDSVTIEMCYSLDDNLVHLTQIEKLKVEYKEDYLRRLRIWMRTDMADPISHRLHIPHCDNFPPNLKKLTLCRTYLQWEDKNFLGKLPNLEQIPFDFAEIQTLQLIELHKCKLSVIASAEQIQEEQQSLGNDDLVVRVHYIDKMMS
ncbi:hypothetical protein RND71_007203 [Anisodus tanguticus]|uniref:Uncharacterized protein n=1 Tax=Anisodus tanguticus TaxID=243964 RepID=A0AAE1SJE2_9SOLA|nr:hypothetical protein RND71_007203 [Anisodus tanguticus]